MAGETRADYPKDALRLLAAIGPAASGARPVLEQMRGDDAGDEVADELRRALDAIGPATRRI